MKKNAFREIISTESASELRRGKEKAKREKRAYRERVQSYLLFLGKDSMGGSSPIASLDKRRTERQRGT